MADRGNRLFQGIRVSKKPGSFSSLEPAPCPKLRKRQDRAVVIVCFRQVPIVEDFLQQTHVGPIVIALSFFASDQIRQRKVEQHAAELLCLLAPRQQIGEGWQQVIAKPKLQPLLAPVWQEADLKAAKVVRPPTRPFLQ